jgi:hypothetical protein
VTPPSASPECSPADVTFDQYRDVILEVVAATDLAPRHQGERWLHYKSRAILVLNVRREGKAIPESLLSPLSEAMRREVDSGKSLSHVLIIASVLPSKLPPPKLTEVRKSRIEKTNALKLW